MIVPVLTMLEFQFYWGIFSKDIIRDIDGYYIYWPTTNKGAHTTYSLSIIILLLDTANYQWDQVVKNDPVFQTKDL